MASNYSRGRAFEYRVRDRLYADGAVYVMRAAQSRGSADLVALFPKDHFDNLPVVWLVQCKRGTARMNPDERQRLIRIGVDTGASTYLAEPGENGRGVKFTHI